MKVRLALAWFGYGSGRFSFRFAREKRVYTTTVQLSSLGLSPDPKVTEPKSYGVYHLLGKTREKGIHHTSGKMDISENQKRRVSTVAVYTLFFPVRNDSNSQEPKKEPQSLKIARTAPKKFLNNSRALPNKTWRVPNPRGANPLVAERAPWRSSQSCVTGGQQPIRNPYRFLSFLLHTWQPLCDPDSHSWGRLFQLAGLAPGGVRHSPENKGFEANRTRKFTRKFGKIFVAQVLWGVPFLSLKQFRLLFLRHLEE